MKKLIRCEFGNGYAFEFIEELSKFDSVEDMNIYYPDGIYESDSKIVDALGEYIYQSDDYYALWMSETDIIKVIIRSFV